MPSRILLSTLVVLCSSFVAHAVPPPNLPLPPCEVTEDGEVGACPETSPEVAGSAPGRLSFNSSVMTYVEPQIPPCNRWNKNSDGAWSPTPCYREVFETEVVGCAYVDIRTKRFVETHCPGALFERSTTTQLFDVGRGEGGTCADEGDFSTYVYGGPANQPDKIWAAQGPLAGRCQLSYLGPEPDGLWGPTWVVMRATLDVHTGPTSYETGTRKSTEFYVPIDGELRDLGPVAAFEVASNQGGVVAFANTSVHTRGEAMTYRWDFGDGGTSSEASPTHRYREPGRYSVRLTARDPTDDEDEVVLTVVVDFALVVDLDMDAGPLQVGVPFEVALRVSNPFESQVTDLALIVANGVRFDPALLALRRGPSAVPATLAPGETVSFVLELEPLAPGRSTLEGGARGTLGEARVSDTDTLTVLVPARLSLSLASTVDAETKVGDTFEVVATLTNDEEVELVGIESEPLSLDRADIISIVSGPTALDGSDPRVQPITLGPGDSTAIRWTYRADNPGVVEVTAYASGRDPNTDTLFYVSRDKRLAIEAPALEISELRLSPGSPIPGHFGTARGRVENIGTVPVEGIDFALAANLPVRAIERRITEQGAELSPRITELEVGEAREFVIPYSFSTQADGFGHGELEVTLRGTVTIDGEDVVVDDSATITAGLDLSTYWSNLLGDYADATLEFFEGVNAWGERSTVGGTVVGGGQGVLNAFQTMGDGLLTTKDLVVDTVSGKYELTDKGEQIVSTIVEYYRTRSFKDIANDWADAGVALSFGIEGAGQQGVETVATWMRDIDVAYHKGDAREVARLVAEPVATVALSAGGEIAVEKAAAKVFGRLVKGGAPRRTLAEGKHGPDPLDEPDFDAPVDEPEVDLPFSERRLADEVDIKDLPTGVPVTEATVLRAGVNAAEHGWMQRMAKEHGVAFFVRPRPAAAADFAELGYNAKPMAIKTKSVNDIDVKWLGWDDWKGKEGLVVMREPKDPWPKLLEAMESGELKWGSQEVDAVIARYNKRRKEWAQKGALFDELNGKNGGKGFEIQRNGKTILTKVTLDDNGVMRFTHNNQPVYSDIDLLQVARPDGTPIPPELHQKIMEAAGPGFDVQHGDTLSTSDFDSWETAKKFVAEYATEHMRGGDPLVIVQGDVTTFGYVKSVEIPDAVAGSGYDLYGQVSVRYEGAGFP